MIRFAVEMFGLPSEVTELRKVEVELNDGASLADLIAALKHRIPALDGYVTNPGEDRLTEEFTFNINGCFYLDDRELKLQKGDRVVLLPLAHGG